MREALKILAAFFGTVGFAWSFNLKKSNLLLSGLMGMCTHIVNSASMYAFKNELIGYFFAAAFACVLSEIFARIRKTPASTLLIPAAVPLIPGSVLYKAMKCVYVGDWGNFLMYGEETLKEAGFIALGIIAVSTFVKLIAELKNKNCYFNKGVK